MRDSDPRQNSRYRGQANLPLSNLFLMQIFLGKEGGGALSLAPGALMPAFQHSSRPAASTMTKEKQGPNTLFSLLPFLQVLYCI